MHDSMNERPRYLVPVLGGIYGALDAYSWPLVRAATGLFFVPHGLQKLFGMWVVISPGRRRAWPGKVSNRRCSGPTTSPPSKSFAEILLAIGFLTRPIAVLFVGFMAVAAFHVHMPLGWFWTNRGMEVPLYLMLICIAIAIRGGGALSVDRLLRREI